MNGDARAVGADDTSATITFEPSTACVDWSALKRDLAADNFDNGRSPEQLRRSFEKSHSVVFAWSDGRCVGTARLLSDGVCNAYLVDVWTASSHRRRGIASRMIGILLDTVPGQHVALFTSERTDLYTRLGFTEERTGMSRVSGTWLRTT
jgi:predicted GNAT family acetyltransferase